METDVRMVRISSKGQIAIPKKIRERLGLSQGSDLAVQVQGDTVVLRKTPKSNWRKWAGRFRGSGVLQELTASRRDEIARDSKSS